MIGCNNQWRCSSRAGRTARLRRCRSALPLCHMKQVYCLDFLWELLLFSGDLLVGCIVIFAWCVEPLVSGIEFAGLLEDSTISVGMICRLPGGTVDLAYFVQDFV